MIIRSVLMHRCGGSEGCVGTRKRDVRIYMCARTRGIELDDDFESIVRGVFHL